MITDRENTYWVLEDEVFMDLTGKLIIILGNIKLVLTGYTS